MKAKPVDPHAEAGPSESYRKWYGDCAAIEGQVRVCRDHLFKRVFVFTARFKTKQTHFYYAVQKRQ